MIMIWGDLSKYACPLQPRAENLSLQSSARGVISLSIPLPLILRAGLGSELAARVPLAPPTPSLFVRKSPSRLPC